MILLDVDVSVAARLEQIAGWTGRLEGDLRAMSLAYHLPTKICCRPVKPGAEEHAAATGEYEDGLGALRGAEV